MPEGKPKIEKPFDQDEGVTDKEHDALRILLNSDDGEEKKKKDPPEEKRHGEF